MFDVPVCSGCVSRRTGRAALRAQVLDFIAYFNRTLAKPFKWTYLGKPLHA
jgi:putative transposase